MTEINNYQQQIPESVRLTGEQIEQNFANFLALPNSLNELIETFEDSDKLQEIYRSAKIISIDPKQVIIDERLNIRSSIDQILVDDYARMMLDGDIFPPVDLVLNERGEYAGVDGRLTLEAALSADIKQIKGRLLDCSLTTAFGIKIQNSASYRQNWTTQQKKPFVVALLKQLNPDDIRYRELGRAFKIDHKNVINWHKEIKKNRVSYNGEIPRTGANADGEIPQSRNDDSNKQKEYKFPVRAIEIHRDRYPVEVGDCYRAEAPDGTNHYVFCADNNGPVLAPFYGLNIFDMNASDPPWGNDTPSDGRTYDKKSANAFFGNVELRGSDLELMLMNALSNLKKCLRPGATYTIFLGYYERSMFERHCDNILGDHHNSLYWIKKDYIRSRHAVVSFGTEEALFGWTRGGQKPAKTEGYDNVFLGCEYREHGNYSSREFIEDSQHDVGGEYHPCSKPVYLLKAFIQLFSKAGAVVVDNFAGSGSTGVACQLSKRQFVGVEMVPEFAAVILYRLEKLGCTIHKMQPGDAFLFPSVCVLGSGFFTKGGAK